MTTRFTKQLITVIAALLSFSALGMNNAARAQGQALPKTPEEFMQQIGITAAQKAKLQAITEKYRPKMAVIQEKYGPKFQALQKQMFELQQKAAAEAKPIRDQQQKESDAVLTPDQRTKIKQIQAALMNQQRQAAASAGQAPPK